MNAKKHFGFALILGASAIYVLKDFITLDYPFIIFHSIFYLIGATSILDYGIFDNYRLGIGHHGVWHSRAFLWGLILLVIPLSVYLYIIYKKYFLFNIPFNVWSIVAFTCGGMVIHLLCDSNLR